MDPDELRAAWPETERSPSSAEESTFQVHPGEGFSFPFVARPGSILRWTQTNNTGPDDSLRIVLVDSQGSVSLPKPSAGLLRPTHRSLRLEDHLAGYGEVFFLFPKDPASAGPATIADLRLERPEPRRPDNIFLVVVDTLRGDHLSILGNSRLCLPHITDLAIRGPIFSQAFTHIPITGPSHSALFASRYPSEIGITNNGMSFPQREIALAEVLRADGWRTAAFTSLGVLDAKFGFDQGFETFVDDMPPSWIVDSREINRRVFDYLETCPREGNFFFIHYCDPHEPYLSHGADFQEVRVTYEDRPLPRADIANRFYFEYPLTVPPGVTNLRLTGEREFRLRNSLIEPAGSGIQIAPGEGWRKDIAGTLAATDGVLRLINRTEATAEVEAHLFLTEILAPEEVRERYIREVEYNDRAIGQLHRALEGKGMLENSLLVLTSDHGEGLGEHGEIGHVEQLYDSMIHVPLLLSGPGLPSSFGIVEEPVGLCDLFPTVMDLLDIPVLHSIRGRSLVPLLEGIEDPAGAPLVYSETYPPEASQLKRSLRTAKWKYIETPEVESEEPELYRMDEDPKELHNRIGDLTAEAEAFSDRLLEVVASTLLGSATGSAGSVELDEETKSRLRSLGYMH
jgi:arylsulfatase A-like enzyme